MKFELSLNWLMFKKHLNFLSYLISDASLEADVAKGRRDWAFSERDKVKFGISS